MADQDKDARGQVARDRAQAIRNIVRATVSASGEPDPETLPHLVRQQPGMEDASDEEVSAYVEEAMAEMRRA